MNPYWGKDFFSFFILLGDRLAQRLPQDRWPTDEVQLLVLLGTVIATVLIGSFLTLKKMTMMANALSHTTLFGIVIASMILLDLKVDLYLNSSILLFAALLSALLTTSLTQWVRDHLKLSNDSAIGLVFTTLFAIGIILVTIFTRNSHIGVEIVTGNVDALDPEEISLVWTIAITDLVFILLFFRQWTIICFDEPLAASLGIAVRWFHYLMMFLTASTLIAVFRAVGVILVLSFIVVPILIARQWSCRLIPLVMLSLAIGVGCSLLGVALSRHLLSVYHLSFSTAGIVSLLLSSSYLFSTLLTFRRRKGLILKR